MSDDPFEGIGIGIEEKIPNIKTKIDVKQETVTVEDKSQLIFKIQSYGKNKRFAKRLRQAKHNFTGSYLAKRSADDLKLELENIDMTLANSQNSNLIDHSIKYGLSFVETLITKRTPFQIQGTMDKCFEDEHFLDVLERAKMKYGVGGLKMDPILELSLIIAQTALVIHSTQKLINNVSDVNLDEEVP